MALAIDGSTPAVATNAVATTATVTTASFTPPTGALLLVLWSGNSAPGVSPATPTVTDNLGAHLTYSPIDWDSHVDTPFVDGQAASWSAVVGSSAPMTVTVTSGSGSGARESALRVIVLTGQHATPIGAHGKSGSTSAASIAQNFTGTASASWGFLADCDWDIKGTQTAGTGCTVLSSATIGTSISYGFHRRTSADGTIGGTTTLNATLPGTSTNLTWCYVEVVPAATAAAVTYTVDRSSWSRAQPAVQQRPYISPPDLLSTAQLEVPPVPVVARAAVTHQRPGWLRQPAGVADQSTPAATLDPTLAGYGAVARALPATHVDRRLAPAQRTAQADVSSPAAGFDPTLAGVSRQPVLDRRSQPAQRAYISPPDLLTTAQLENELLGGATTTSRAWVFSERRQVPLQRPAVAGPDAPAGAPPAPVLPPVWRRDPVPVTQRAYVSPAGLLDTALLENELLGGATVSIHSWVFTDRRQVPAQRPYVAGPDLLSTALLENELLGSADDLARHRWWSPRPWVGQQRAAVADQSAQPATFDPTTGGGLARWLAYTLAGWDTDRRLVPQQRAYISDPSSYPTTPPTDPLTVAWGVGGAYWLLYNTVALTTSRRLVPQQRPYVSDPLMLSTALLEGVLLGSVDDVARHRTVFTDRRYVPAPRPLWSDPQLLVVTDPTTVAAGVGGDLWRRVNTPTTHNLRWVLRTWRQALEFMGVPPTGAVTGYARPGDGLRATAGPGVGGTAAQARPGDGSTTTARGG